MAFCSESDFRVDHSRAKKTLFVRNTYNLFSTSNTKYLNTTLLWRYSKQNDNYTQLKTDINLFIFTVNDSKQTHFFLLLHMYSLFEAISVQKLTPP